MRPALNRSPRSRQDGILERTSAQRAIESTCTAKCAEPASVAHLVAGSESTNEKRLRRGAAGADCLPCSLELSLRTGHNLAMEVGVTLSCQVCGLANFRTSHLRLSDLPRLLILQYPIRCAECRTRTFVPCGPVLRLGIESKLSLGNHGNYLYAVPSTCSRRELLLPHLRSAAARLHGRGTRPPGRRRAAKHTSP